MKIKSLIFVLIIMTSPIASQHIGISFSKLWTDNYELENPNGFSINLSRPIYKNIELQFEYSRFENRRNYFGNLISGFMAPPIPPQENIESISNLYSYSLSFKYYLKLIPVIKVALGAGLNYNRMEGSRTARPSGRKANLFDEESFGYSLIAYVESRFIRILPVTLYTSVQKNMIFSGDSVTDVESPFSSSIDGWLLQTGIKFKF